jgi:hypothetical protein
MGLCYPRNGATHRQVEAWKRSYSPGREGLIDLIEVAWRPLASAVLVQEKLAIREAENHCVWYPHPRLRNLILRRRTLTGTLQVCQLGLQRGVGVCE